MSLFGRGEDCNVLRRMQKHLKQVSLTSPQLSMACLDPSSPPFDFQNVSIGAKVLLPGFQSVLVPSRLVLSLFFFSTHFNISSCSYRTIILQVVDVYRYNFYSSTLKLPVHCTIYLH